MKYLIFSAKPNQSLPTWVVLAGGGSIRFGKATKALALLKGKSLLQRVISAGLLQVSQVVVNIHTTPQTTQADLQAYQALGVPLLEELPPFNQGPLGGMASAWQQLTDDWLLFVPCDTPFLPADLYPQLQAALQAETVPLSVVYDGERIQPLCCLMHRCLLPSLQMAISQGKLSVKRWIASEPHVAVDFSEQAAAFVSLNTPADLSVFERSLL